jgi:hypothetical protein
MLVNDILCLVEGFLASLFELLNSTLGGLLGFELAVPSIGCEMEEEMPAE